MTGGDVVVINDGKNVRLQDNVTCAEGFGECLQGWRLHVGS